MSQAKANPDVPNWIENRVSRMAFTATIAKFLNDDLAGSRLIQVRGSWFGSGASPQIQEVTLLGFARPDHVGIDAAIVYSDRAYLYGYLPPESGAKVKQVAVSIHDVRVPGMVVIWWEDKDVLPLIVKVDEDKPRNYLGWEYASTNCYITRDGQSFEDRHNRHPLSPPVNERADTILAFARNQDVDVAKLLAVPQIAYEAEDA